MYAPTMRSITSSKCWESSTMDALIMVSTHLNSAVSVEAGAGRGSWTAHVCSKRVPLRKSRDGAPAATICNATEEVERVSAAVKHDGEETGSRSREKNNRKGKR